jgi:hypothetical protein
LPVIEPLIDKLTVDQCDQQVMEGKWTIRQQLAHLVRYQEVFFENIKTIMSTFNAVIKPYSANEDPEFLTTARLPIPELLRRLYGQRQVINEFYVNLNSGELIRKGRHPELGNFSIALWAEYFLLHEAHHIFQIFLISNTVSERE